MLTFFLIVVSLWTILILFATFQDIRQRLSSKPSPKSGSPGISGLSLIDNFQVLTRIEEKHEKHGDKYQLFEYFRAQGHIQMLIFHYLGVLLPRDNQGELAKENPPFVGFFFGQAIKATFVVFFTLNGMAAGKWFFRMFKSKTKPVTTKLVLRFFFERFIMFAPIYYLFIVFYLVYVEYWVPDSFHDQTVVDNCNHSFIANLLFMSNLISSEKMCIPWGWTIMVLYQLTILTPIFVIAFKRGFKTGLVTTILGNLVFLVIIFQRFYSRGFTTEMMSDDIITTRNTYSPMPVKESFFEAMTLKPYIYGPAYINGILFAFLIEHEHHYNELRRNGLFNTLTCLGKWFFIVASLVIAGGRNILYGGLPLFSAIETSLFPTLGSFIFFFVIFERGQAIMFRLFMSKKWTLFRRIQKISYLMNPIVFLLFTDLHFESQLYRLIACIVTHILLSTGLTLLFEIPVFKVFYMMTKNFLYH